MPAASTPADIPTVGTRLPPGTAVGRHVVESWIRDGGMGAIYRGHHVETGARVAIKVMAVQYAQDEVLLARFAREAQLMGRLASVPGVVRVHDVGALDDGRRYLVMEWIDGQDLDDLLDELRSTDRELEIGRACRIVRDVARGMAAAHARQVVHRDLKPSNIMLDQSGGGERAKVVDFGVSADLGTEGREADLTRTGVALGTSGYMAPEQALGLRADPAFDVWALGVLIFECVTGTPVPPGMDANRLPDLRSRRPAAPAALSRLVRSCLLIDMRRRPTAEEVATKLDGILSKLALEAVPPIPEDDRPVETFGHIEGTDPLRPAVRRHDALALGLHAPARLTPVRVKPARPAAAAAAVASEPVPASSVNRGLLAAAAAGVLALGIAAGLAILRSQQASEDAPAAATAATAAIEGGAADGDAPPDPAEPEAEPEGEVEAGAVPAKAEAEVEAESEAEGQAEAEPEAEAEAEAEAEPERPPDRAPRDSKRSKPHKGDPPPSAPAHTTDRCAQMRSQAEDAKTSRNWNRVLSRTRDRACWGRQAERLLLRVTAYAELGRYDECVQTGAGVADSRVATRTKFCRKKGGQ